MMFTCDDLLGLPRRAVTHVRQQLGDTKFLVHLLVIIFAISAWADMNGLWVELPLLVLKAPEGWNLPSYITIISQVANIGPLLFVCVSVLMPRAKYKLEKYTSFIIIAIGTLSAFLLAFFWHETSYIGGTQHSTALLVLNFFLALGDCTSSVCFYAFMAFLKPQYMASLFIGESLSGMLPAMIALGQGAGDIICVNKSQTANKTFPNGTQYNVTTYSVLPEYVQPNFSVQVFFFALTTFLASSGIAFFLLNVLPACQSEMVDPAAIEYEEFIHEKDLHRNNENQQERRTNQKNNYGSTVGNSISHTLSSSILDDSEFNYKGDNPTFPADLTSSLPFDTIQKPQSTSTSSSDSRVLTVYLRLPSISPFRFIAILTIVGIINLTLASFLNTIQIFSTLPYGLQPYHLTTTLVAISHPIACFTAFVFVTKSLAAIGAITLSGLVGVAYIIYLAAMSPVPPLLGQDAGVVLAVGTWMLTSLLLTYAKVCAVRGMRQYGRNALIWAGVATQAGSFIGALVGFILTQFTHVFVKAKYC